MSMQYQEPPVVSLGLAEDTIEQSLVILQVCSKGALIPERESLQKGDVLVREELMSVTAGLSQGLLSVNQFARDLIHLRSVLLHGQYHDLQSFGVDLVDIIQRLHDLLLGELFRLV